GCFGNFLIIDYRLALFFGNLKTAHAELGVINRRKVAQQHRDSVEKLEPGSGVEYYFAVWELVEKGAVGVTEDKDAHLRMLHKNFFCGSDIRSFIFSHLVVCCIRLHQIILPQSPAKIANNKIKGHGHEQ